MTIVLSLTFLFPFSSADLYVRDHFHPFIDKKNDGMRPIRIKANNKSALFATDEITLKYCFLSEDRQYFLPPTKAKRVEAGQIF